MQCSCGSSSFASSNLVHTFDTRACEYSFSACKSCGRQGGHVISDLRTGEVLTTGMAAIRSIQKDELEILGAIDPWLVTKGAPVEQVQVDDLNNAVPDPEQTVSQDKQEGSTASPAVFDLNGVDVPMKQPLTAAEKGKALHERGRHYFFWNSESHNVRVKFHHHLFDNGVEEVSFPALGLIDHRKSGQDQHSPLMNALALVETVLERHFDESTKTTGITCAPPQGDWLEIYKDGEWVSILEAEPSVENGEPAVEDDPAKDLVNQDVEASLTDASTQALVMDEMEEPEDMAVHEDECDPLAVSSHEDSKEAMQMSLF